MIDQVTVAMIYLAAQLHRPFLLEGPAGSGKIQLAYALAQVAGTEVERLQRYQAGKRREGNRQIR